MFIRFYYDTISEFKRCTIQRSSKSGRFCATLYTAALYNAVQRSLTTHREHTQKSRVISGEIRQHFVDEIDRATCKSLTGYCRWRITSNSAARCFEIRVTCCLQQTCRRVKLRPRGPSHALTPDSRNLTVLTHAGSFTFPCVSVRTNTINYTDNCTVRHSSKSRCTRSAIRFYGAISK